MASLKDPRGERGGRKIVTAPPLLHFHGYKSHIARLLRMQTGCGFRTSETVTEAVMTVEV